MCLCFYFTTSLDNYPLILLAVLHSLIFCLVWGLLVGFHLTTRLHNYSLGLFAVLQSLIPRAVGCESWFSFNSSFVELSLIIVNSFN